MLNIRRFYAAPLCSRLTGNSSQSCMQGIERQRFKASFLIALGLGSTLLGCTDQHCRQVGDLQDTPEAIVCGSDETRFSPQCLNLVEGDAGAPTSQVALLATESDGSPIPGAVVEVFECATTGSALGAEGSSVAASACSLDAGSPSTPLKETYSGTVSLTGTSDNKAARGACTVVSPSRVSCILNNQGTAGFTLTGNQSGFTTLCTTKGDTSSTLAATMNVLVRRTDATTGDSP